MSSSSPLQTILDQLPDIEQRHVVLASIFVLILSLVVFTRKPDYHPPSSSSIACEPPRAPFGIPFLNHTFSFGAGPSLFLKKIRSQTRHPQPYTVTVGTNTKFYIFNGPNDHLQVLWRNSANLDFATFAIKFTRWILGGSEKDYDIVFRDCNRPGSFMHGWQKIFHTLPEKEGPLKTLNENGVKGYSEQLNILKAKVESQTSEGKIDFLATLREAMLVVIMDSFWGLRNPLRESDRKKFEDQYFLYEDEVIGMVYSPFPAITHRKCIAAREYLVKLFIDYLNDPQRMEGAMEFIRIRKTHYDSFKIQVDNHARSEVGLVFAALSNTAPTMFWCAYHAFHNKNLLAELRDELLETKGVTYTAEEVVLNMTIITNKCRLLRAVWDEVLRYYQDVFFSRTVLSDTVVTPSFSSEYGGTRSYLLKKGSVAQVPMGVVLSDTLTWGDDADKFDPYRFLEQVNDQSKSRNGRDDMEKRRDAAFKPFGGGSTHCPGRFFAWTEVSGLVAGLVAVFDVEMPEESTFKVNRGDGSGVRKATGPVWAGMKVRKEAEGRKVVMKW